MAGASTSPCAGCDRASARKSVQRPQGAERFFAGRATIKEVHKKRRPAFSDRAPKCAVTRERMPGGDTGIQRRRVPLASGGQCLRTQTPSEAILCRKDTHFNYFLLKRSLEDFILVRTIFAIAVRGNHRGNAWRKAWNRARLTGSRSAAHSGCHCTPSRKPLAPGSDTASISPSGAWASASRPGASRAMPW